jgi:hypothetical protein
MFFLVRIIMTNAYSLLESSTKPTFERSFIQAFTKACSMSFNLWSLENRGTIIQGDVYLLHLEFPQLLKVKNKTMNIIL